MGAREGRSLYWDYPDPFLPASEDPFSIFAVEMEWIDGWEAVEGAENCSASYVRRRTLEGLMNLRKELHALFDLEDPQERLQPGFLREKYAALRFWPSGDELGPECPGEDEPWT